MKIHNSFLRQVLILDDWKNFQDLSWRMAVSLTKSGVQDFQRGGFAGGDFGGDRLTETALADSAVVAGADGNN